MNLSRLSGCCSLLKKASLTVPISHRILPMASAATKPVATEDFFTRNSRLKRPISPHLTIYKFQITTVLSITHRFTGIALAGSLYGLALGTLTLPQHFPYYIGLLQNLHLSPVLLAPVKFTLAWCFFYHLCNGARHLAWDMGHGFELDTVTKTGYAVLGTSLFLTLAAFAL